MPAVAGRLMDWLGFRYLALRRFARESGTLEDMATKVIEETVEAVGPAPQLVPA